MSTCFDIYVLPSGCDVIWTYPSVVHPPPPDSGGGGGSTHYVQPHVPKRKRKRHRDTEEDALFVLGLL